MPNPILMVEDDDDTRAFFTDLLTMAGYEVLAAANSERACQLLKTYPPALVILDLMAGRRYTGLKIIDAIRYNPATASVPILLCSADVDVLEKVGDGFRSIGCDT